MLSNITIWQRSVLFLLCVLIHNEGFAEDTHMLINMQKLEQSLQPNDHFDRRVLQNALKLPQNKAVTFWPVYEEYQSRMRRLADKGITLIQSYTQHYTGQGDGFFASQIVASLFDIEEQSLKIRKHYYARFTRMLDPSQLLKLYQYENRLRNERELQIQSLIPVIK